MAQRAFRAHMDDKSGLRQFAGWHHARDLEALMAVFSEDAMVNDDLQERWGKAAIRKWAEEEANGSRSSSSNAPGTTG